MVHWKRYSEFGTECAPTGDDQNDCAICRTHWEAEPRIQTIHGTHKTRYKSYKVHIIKGKYKVHMIQGTYNAR